MSTIQNAVVQKAFGKKIDEIYRITYGRGTEPACEILAVPTDGLSAEEQNAIVDTFSETSITVFKRYGFIVAVVGHDNAVEADLDSIEAKYRAKMEEAQKTASAYGSYSASGANNGNSYGSGSSSLSSMAGGMGTYSENMSGGNRNSAVANAMGIPADILSDYLEEVQTATKDARTASRRAVLPFVRKRFTAPASAADANDFVEALRQTDGVAVVYVVDGIEGLADLTSKQLKSADDEIAQPFAGLGSGSDDEEAGSLADPIVDALKEQKTSSSVKTITVAISLVETPKVAALAVFDNSDDAKNFADEVAAALALAKPAAKDALDEQLAAVSGQSVDFTPFVDDVFEALRPKTQDNKVAVFLDLAVVEKNASLLLPLLGGQEFKSEQELESDSIDWSVADDENGSDSSTDATQDDDPFADPADDEEELEDNADEGEDDDPFGSDDDDPFA